ncbi:MAG: transcriptional regulator [Symbiobacteriaceae bacterium]|jgi:DNA-binding MarR family transcriptional regulator|nr:transcriptional regulator [Symbiobacteriaceae bacterium]
MQQLLDLFLTGGARLPFFNTELFALDKELPKSDFLALLLLQRRGEATMSELAADLNAPLSTATGIGARLERRKLIERYRHPKDKRVIVLRLTPAGLDLAARARAQIDALLARIQQALSPDEVQQLMGLVQKIFAALQSPPAGDRPEAQTAANQPRRIQIDG